MAKLTTEFLSKLQDNLLQFQDAYSDPADKENYDIFVDALHVIDEFKAAKEKLLASLEAEPVGEFYHEKQGGWYQISEGDKVSDNRRIPLYAAPVLPKQDGTLISEGTTAAHAQPVKQITSATAPEVFEIAAEAERLGIRGTHGSYVVGWNACRDAMLKAQPVSEPYKLSSGYALVPCKLTAENGAKSCMIGEFTEQTEISCPECFGDDECETCDGSGMIEVTVPVSWTTIKDIWVKGIEHFAAAPAQESE